MTIFSDTVPNGASLGAEYRILYQRHGAFSVVYFVEDTASKQFHALKTFDAIPEYTDLVLQTAFVEEASLWLQLGKHANIVECLGVRVINSRHYLALQWIVGTDTLNCSLADFLHYRPLAALDALRHCEDICHGILHAQKIHPGFVHCDIHPGNVLIDSGKTALLTDFGMSTAKEALSHLIDDSRVETHNTLHGGHAAYLSPERWARAAYDERADIYSIGCVLFEMITGRHAFRGDSLLDLRRAHEADDRPVIASPETAIAAVNQILVKCLAVDPNDRWPDIESFLSAVETINEEYGSRKVGAIARNNDLPREVARTNIASGLCQLQQFDTALVQIEAALEMNDQYARAYDTKSQILLGMGRYEDALQTIVRAVELDPTDAYHVSNKGLILRHLGEDEQAESCYRDAASLDDSWFVPWANLGNVHFEQGRFSEAIEAYSQAIARNPNEGELYVRRAQAQRELGIEPELILRVLDEGISRNVRVADAHVFRAEMLQLLASKKNSRERTELLRKAVDAYTKALQMHYSDLDKGLNPRLTLKDLPLPYVHYRRGRAWEKLGVFRKALDDYSSAIQIHPDQPVFFEARGNLYRELGMEKLAEEDLSRVDIDIGWVRKASDEAIRLVNEREFAQAIELYTEIIEKLPFEISDSYTNRGVAYQGLGEYDRAMQDFEKAHQIDPLDNDVLVNMALLCIQIGDTAKAIEYFRSAAELGDPQAILALNTLTSTPR